METEGQTTVRGPGDAQGEMHPTHLAGRSSKRRERVHLRRVHLRRRGHDTEQTASATAHAPDEAGRGGREGVESQENQMRRGLPSQRPENGCFAVIARRLQQRRYEIIIEGQNGQARGVVAPQSEAPPRPPACSDERGEIFCCLITGYPLSLGFFFIARRGWRRGPRVTCPARLRPSGSAPSRSPSAHATSVGSACGIAAHGAGLTMRGHSQLGDWRGASAGRERAGAVCSEVTG